MANQARESAQEYIWRWESESRDYAVPNESTFDGTVEWIADTVNILHNVMAPYEVSTDYEPSGIRYRVLNPGNTLFRDGVRDFIRGQRNAVGEWALKHFGYEGESQVH